MSVTFDNVQMHNGEVYVPGNYFIQDAVCRSEAVEFIAEDGEITRIK